MWLSVWFFAMTISKLWNSLKQWLPVSDRRSEGWILYRLFISCYELIRLSPECYQSLVRAEKRIHTLAHLRIYREEHRKSLPLMISTLANALHQQFSTSAMPSDLKWNCCLTAWFSDCYLYPSRGSGTVLICGLIQSSICLCASYWLSYFTSVAEAYCCQISSYA